MPPTYGISFAQRALLWCDRAPQLVLLSRQTPQLLRTISLTRCLMARSWAPVLHHPIAIATWATTRSPSNCSIVLTTMLKQQYHAAPLRILILHVCTCSSAAVDSMRPFARASLSWCSYGPLNTLRSSALTSLIVRVCSSASLLASLVVCAARTAAYCPALC